VGRKEYEILGSKREGCSCELTLYSNVKYPNVHSDVTLDDSSYVDIVFFSK